MKKYLVLLLLILQQLAFSQIIITLDCAQDTFVNSSSIYIAGNFQGWNPDSSDYQFIQLEDGKFVIEFTPTIGELEFKFTKGSWDTVEGSANSQPISNRTFNYLGGKVHLDLTINGWESQDDKNKTSTAQSNVMVLTENFMIPQLNRPRRLSVYLPPDYTTTQKKYPVLYMHDGQNLFDESTSFSGEWKVDEALNKLHTDGDYGAIVIAIDNGQDQRTDEYSPWINTKYGGGEGHEYMDFIVHTLKPYIDKNYRTLSGREYTGLMGSSMGGLISFYGGIEYPEVFSMIGVFSPSYWFSTKVYEHVTASEKKYPMKIYTLVGDLEGSEMLNGVNKMERILIDSGFSDEDLSTRIVKGGQHNEFHWSREFSTAYQWLFGDIDITRKH